jgi:hypothetical protein
LVIFNKINLKITLFLRIDNNIYLSVFNNDLDILDMVFYNNIITLKAKMIMLILFIFRIRNTSIKILNIPYIFINIKQTFIFLVFGKVFKKHSKKTKKTIKLLSTSSKKYSLKNKLLILENVTKDNKVFEADAENGVASRLCAGAPWVGSEGS